MGDRVRGGLAAAEFARNRGEPDPGQSRGLGGGATERGGRAAGLGLEVLGARRVGPELVEEPRQPPAARAGQLGRAHGARTRACEVRAATVASPRSAVWPTSAVMIVTG